MSTPDDERRLSIPTYDYTCRNCGHDLQRVESIARDIKARPRCPQCKSTKVERVFASVFVKTGKKS